MWIRSVALTGVRSGILKQSSPRPRATAAAALSSAWHTKSPFNAAAAAASSLFVARSFSSNNAPSSSTLSYYEKKKQAKERRRELYEKKMERKEKLPMRRQGQRRDDLRREFRAFFIKKKVDEEYMDRKARQAGLDWKIDVAVILERQNVVLPDKEPWETEWDNLQAHLGRFGKMYPKGLVGDIDYDSKDIAMTDEELLALLPEGFKPAPRETLADETGDVRTTDRKLKTSVYLTVQDKGGKWMLPTVTLKDDGEETLLGAAQRALAEKIGPEVEYWGITNCPCAVDMVPLPTTEQRSESGVYGTKTFFIKLHYDEGQVSETSMQVKDYAWLDRGEITEKMRAEHGDYMAKFYHYLM